MILYRYDDRLWANKAKKRYYLRTFERISTTPKGYWIQEIKGEEKLKKKWISIKTKHPFAERTKAEALFAYYRRKRVHLQYIREKYHNMVNIKNDVQRLIENMCDIPYDMERFMHSWQIEDIPKIDLTALDRYLQNFLDKEEMEL